MVLRAVRVVPVRPVVAGAADIADQLPRVQHLAQRALGDGAEFGSKTTSRLVTSQIDVVANRGIKANSQSKAVPDGPKV